MTDRKLHKGRPTKAQYSKELQGSHFLLSLKRQCLAVRIDCIEKMRAKVMAWNNDRNNSQTKVDWHFETVDARTKLKRLYPKN